MTRDRFAADCVAHQAGNRNNLQTQDRLCLGSRILFDPKVVIGHHVAGPLAIEASYTYISHVHLGGHQNPGLETLGVRGVARF